MGFTERHQRYGGISRIKREGSVLAGALFVLGEAESGEEGQGGLRGAGGNGAEGKAGGFRQMSGWEAQGVFSVCGFSFIGYRAIGIC